LNTISSTVNEVYNVLDSHIHQADVNIDILGVAGAMTGHSKVKKKNAVAKFRRDKMGPLESIFSQRNFASNDE